MENENEAIQPSDIVEEIVLDEDAEGGDEIEDDDDNIDLAEESQDGDTDSQWENESQLSTSEEVYIDDSAGGFTEHAGPIYAVAINPTNPTIIASGGGDDKAFLWNKEDGSVIHCLEGHSDSVAALAFSYDGKYLATGGLDGAVKIWLVSTGKLEADLEGADEVEWVTWHPKGHVVLAGSASGSTFMWSVPNGTLMNVFSGHNSRVTSGGFTPDGKNIITASEDMSLIAWDPKTAEQISKISSTSDGRFHQEPITSMAINNDNVLVITGSLDHKAIVTHSKTGKMVSVFEGHTDTVESVAFSSTHPWAASGSLDGTACIWDIPNNRLRHKLVHKDAVIRVQFHPTQPLLITVSLDRTVRIWDARTGELQRELHGHMSEPLDMAVSLDGSFLITGGDDKHALIFKVSA